MVKKTVICTVAILFVAIAAYSNADESAYYSLVDKPWYSLDGGICAYNSSEKTKEKVFLLHELLEKGDIKSAKAIVKKDSQKNEKGCDCTVLHYAAGLDYLDVTKLLLEYKADVEARTCFHATPLFVAVGSSSSLKMVELLIGHGAYPNPNALSGEDGDDMSAFNVAISSKRYDIAKLIVQRLGLKSMNIDDVMALGDTTLLREKIASGVDVNEPLYHCSDASGECWAHLPISTDNIDMLRVLIELGADVNAVPLGISGPQLSLIHGVERMKLLFEGGANVNKFFDSSALQNAVLKKDADVVNLLLENGADRLDSYTLKSSYSPLCSAIFNADEEVVRLLLDRDAVMSSCGSIDVKSFAKSKGNPVIVRMLDEYGNK